MRRARSVAGGLQSKQFVPVATPLSPLLTTSATLTEAFAPGLHSTATPYLYSDSGGSFTTVATLGGKVGSVKAMGGRSETMKQTAAANQYTYATEANSGLPSLYSIAGNTGMLRSYTGAVGTKIVVYAAYYKGLDVETVQYIENSNTSTGTNVHYLALKNIASPLSDSVHASQTQSDSSTIVNDMITQLGAPDVVCWRSDATNGNSLARSGVQAGSKVTGTGTLTTTAIAYPCLGYYYTSGGAIATSATAFLGNMLGYFTWSGPLSDAEMAGVSAWCVANLTKQPQLYQGDHVGFYFYGDGTTDETGGSLNPMMVRSGDLIHWNMVPLIGVGITAGQRDLGVCYDPVTNGFYIVSTGSNGYFYLSSVLDKKTWNQIGPTINVLSLTTNSSKCWAPDFVKNADGSLWLDGSGLPRVVFSWGLRSGGNFQAATIKPNDATSWKTGGTWQSAANITWAAAPTNGLIDCSIVYDNSPGGTGLFHMVFSQNTSGVIGHATASSLDGTWTQQGAQDAFGLGTPLEGPELHYRAYDNSWIIHLDNVGSKYTWARSTTGINGPYSTPSQVICAACPEQGGMSPVPQGY